MEIRKSDKDKEADGVSCHATVTRFGGKQRTASLLLFLNYQDRALDLVALLHQPDYRVLDCNICARRADVWLWPMACSTCRCSTVTYLVVEDRTLFCPGRHRRMSRQVPFSESTGNSHCVPLRPTFQSLRARTGISP